jgi:chemosensory pili system protein ChpA (sensor histidine kinase/response regulator)
LHVRVADHEYAIPFASIRQMFMAPEAGILVSLPDAEPNTIAARFRRRVRVARPSPQRPLRLPDDPTAALYDEVPVFSLAELLGLDETPPVTHMALLIEVGQRQVAVLVDEILDESEVVIRALPAHLRRRAVRGASIASDGRLFLVLDIADLLTDALGGKTVPPTRPVPATVPSRDRTPVVLVVDDSISIRHALEGALSSVGYDVRLARDGVEALGAMIADPPDIMVLDLEMPRLDGFELLSVIRANESLARTPVVILTSRAAEKYHRQAMDLGVRAYLTKPCPDEVLITTLQRVLRERQ